MQAAWLLTSAFGNLIIVIIEEMGHFKSQATMFFVYAGLMVVDTAAFALLAIRYKYVKREDSLDADTETDGDENKEKGQDNNAYENDEKNFE